MPKILIPFDGSDDAQHALTYARGLSKENPAVELCLLNVHEPIDDGRVAAYLSFEKIHALTIAAGERILEPARALLDASKLPYVAEIRIGHTAKTIVDYCDEQKCDSIVMGTRGLGALGNMVMGSIAQKVLHLVHVPVTLVK